MASLLQHLRCGCISVDEYGNKLTNECVLEYKYARAAEECSYLESRARESMHRRFQMARAIRRASRIRAWRFRDLEAHRKSQ